MSLSFALTRRESHRPALRLLGAVGVAAAGVVLAEALQAPLGGVGLVAPLALLAVFALLEGTGPALLATALDTAALAALAVLPLPGHASLPPHVALLRVAAFLLVAGLTVAIAGGQRRVWGERARRAAGESESQARLRVLTEAMPQFVFVTRPSGLLDYVNAQWTRYSGLDLDETNRAGWQGCMHPEDLARARCAWAETTAGDQPRELEMRYRAADGGYRWFSVVFAPLLRDASGRPAQWIGTATDIHARKVVEERLVASERRVRTILEASPVGTVLGTADGRVLYANDTYLRTTGASREALEHGTLRWGRLTAPEDRPKDRRAVEQALSRGAAALYEKEYLRPDGTRVPVLIAVASLGGGELAAFTLDVTERRRAEEALRASEAQFRQLAEAVPQLVWVTCPSGRVLYLNQRWREYMGARPDDTGEGWMRQLHPDDAALTAERWRRSVETGEPYQIEYRLRRSSDGAWRWFLSRALPVRGQDGRIDRWIGTSTDIDDQKRAVAELAQAKQRLEEADRNKNDFLALLSHELRNPLAPIHNSLYVLERSPGGAPQARRALSVIDRQVRLLTRLVEDLLDLTRIARGKIRLQRERLELGELVRRAAEDRRSVFSRSRIQLDLLTPRGPLWADLDAVRLSQVVSNLLGNAAKFTPPGGRVTVSLGAEGGGAVLRVADSGVGIAPDLLARLFQPFVQAERGLDRNRSGLGLGLALVKGLVELHGGRVSARSEGVGKGAQFEVRLPLASEARAAPRQAHAAERSAAARARHILVIEDNADAAESLKEVLELDQHEVELAGSGPEGLAKAHARRPDLILCDIGLPGMDGYEVARSLRADPDPRLAHTPLVALSGYAAPEDVERARAAGFDRHVAKPVEVSVLEGMLHA